MHLIDLKTLFLGLLEDSSLDRSRPNFDDALALLADHKGWWLRVVLLIT